VADLAEPLICNANMRLSALRATALLTQNCVYQSVKERTSFNELWTSSGILGPR